MGLLERGEFFIVVDVSSARSLAFVLNCICSEHVQWEF